MRKRKHTPAPWRVEDHGANCGNAIRFEVCSGSGSDYELVASIETDDPREAVGNARLIAEAPNLLRTLDEARACLIALKTAVVPKANWPKHADALIATAGEAIDQATKTN